MRRKFTFGPGKWPSQAVEILKEMRTRCETLKNIADQLGITRSMVSGKVRRLGLPKIKPVLAVAVVPKPPGKPKPRFRPRRSAKRCRPHPAPIAAPAPPPPPPPPPIPEPPPEVAPVHIRKLRSFHCRAIVARGEDELAMYCGRKVTRTLSGALSSWCPDHYRLFIDLQRTEHGKARAYH